MNKEKLTYLSPETETLVVRFEESVLQGGSPGSGYNRNGGAGNAMNENDDYNYSF